MSSEEPVIGAEPPESGGESASPVEVVKAVLLGLRDTWATMVEEGRRGAHATYERRWRDFDQRTRRRRPPRD